MNGRVVDAGQSDLDRIRYICKGLTDVQALLFDSALQQIRDVFTVLRIDPALFDSTLFATAALPLVVSGIAPRGPNVAPLGDPTDAPGVGTRCATTLRRSCVSSL